MRYCELNSLVRIFSVGLVLVFRNYFNPMSITLYLWYTYEYV